MILYDGAAMVLGVVAASFVVFHIYRLVKNREYVIDKTYLFSALYIGGITLLTIAFNGNVIYSLNRYIFPTVFCCFFIFKANWLECINWKRIFFFLLIITPFWFLFKSWVHIQTFLKYMVVSIYLCLLLTSFHKDLKASRLAIIAAYFMGIIVQVHLLFMFMDCEWVA
jgi:hypothetical protein